MCPGDVRGVICVVPEWSSQGIHNQVQKNVRFVVIFFRKNINSYNSLNFSSKIPEFGRGVRDGVPHKIAVSKGSVTDLF